MKSEIFATHYLPVGLPEDEHYKEPYGFYWPRKKDLEELILTHPNFNIHDLNLEKICWKPEGLSFAMIQLVFRNGVSSPIFKVKGCDPEDYLSSLVKQGEINWIKLKIEGDK
jgi:hypothetical protein